MKIRAIVPGLCVVLISILIVFVGCHTRSISDSDYSGRYCRYHSSDTELSEFNVLGITTDKPITDQDISAQQDATHTSIKLKKETGILIIQSGAMFPDEPMQREMSKIMRTGSFSGIPSKGENDYSKKIRLCAARGGYEYILCYWGFLETSRKKLATKGVSWVPIVGDAIPDETQQTRIRLKAYLIDVKTGQWVMFGQEIIGDNTVSAQLNRESADQTQVTALKEKAYAALVAEFKTKFME